MRKLLLNIVAIICTVTTSLAVEPASSEFKTYVNLSISETNQIQPDLLTARLVCNVEASSAKTAQEEVNKIMTKAVTSAKSATNIEYFTENYYVYEYKQDDNKKGQGVIYKASQHIIIKSSASHADALKLAGELQNMGFLMQGLNYSLSNSKLEEVKDNMLASALQKLQNKAKFIAKTIGKDGARLVELNIDTNNYVTRPPYPMLKTMATTNEQATPPIAEPENMHVILNISAKVEM